jgi:hypothetical protein
MDTRFFHTPVNHLIRLHFSLDGTILAETGQRSKKLKSMLQGNGCCDGRQN